MELIKLAGIYDKRTMKMGLELGLNSFEFDFRPTSFNFIQQYVLEEIVKDVQDHNPIIAIHFQNEANFMVDNILSSFKDSSVSPRLVFSDTQNSTYYNSFKTPFYWHYSTDGDVKGVLSSSYNEGVILSYGLLEDLHHKGNLQAFISNFYTMMRSSGSMNKKIGLKIDWDSNLAPSIFDLVDFDFIELSVNNKIEVCYRNVDSIKLKKNLSILKNLTC